MIERTPATHMRLKNKRQKRKKDTLAIKRPNTNRKTLIINNFL